MCTYIYIHIYIYIYVCVLQRVHKMSGSKGKVDPLRRACVSAGATAEVTFEAYIQADSRSMGSYSKGAQLYSRPIIQAQGLQVPKSRVLSPSLDKSSLHGSPDFSMSLRVQVPKYEVCTLHHNYDSQYRNHMYTSCLGALDP